MPRPRQTAPVTRGRRIAFVVTAAIAGLTVAAFVLAALLLDRYRVPSEAMTPTVSAGDRVWARPTHDVGRRDIVILRAPLRTGVEGTLMSRVVAVGGDTVQAEGGALLVNDQEVDEPFETPDIRPTEVPDGHVYVLGDNRFNSQGSNVYGPVAVDDVVARVVRIGDPPSPVLLLLMAAVCVPFVVVLVSGRRHRREA